MADKIRRADYQYVQVPDKPGEGARILGALKDAGVNLLSLTAFPDGKGTTQIDLVTENADGLAKAAKGLGLKLSDRKRAFFIQGDDRAGAAAEGVAVDDQRLQRSGASRGIRTITRSKSITNVLAGLSRPILVGTAVMMTTTPSITRPLAASSMKHPCRSAPGHMRSDI